MQRFNNIFTASGTLNFFGEGWNTPFHRITKFLFRPNYTDTTLITKTTTLSARSGNLKLDNKFQPTSIFPKCIKLYPFKEVILNAVSLSGPGLTQLICNGAWQRIEKPFVISFMSAAENKSIRIDEVISFAHIMKYLKYNFRSEFGIELNVSCPNTHCDIKELTNEIMSQLEALSILPVYKIIKLNVLTPFNVIKEIQESGLCDAISLSNTIPWGTLSSEIDWHGLFSGAVPLQKYGGGGLSGKPLLPIVSRYISSIRARGINMKIIGGGGILKPDDVDTMFNSGANAISIGAVTLLKPWNVNKIIKRAKTYE